jgi:hypothetical protein
LRPLAALSAVVALTLVGVGCGGHAQVQASASPLSGGIPRPLWAQGLAPAVVDIKAASAVVSAYVTARDYAFTHDDLTLLSQIDTDAAKSRDVGDMKGAINARKPGSPAIDTVLQTEFNIPYQTHYPAYFLAVVGGVKAGQSVTWLLTFARDSRRQPWRLANLAAVGAPLSTLGAVNYARPNHEHPGFAAAGNSGPGVDPRGVYPALSRYFLYWLVHGRPPPASSFLPGTFTSHWGAYITAGGRRQDGIDPRGHTFDHISYQTSPQDGVYAFALEGGSTLVCAAFHATQTITPPMVGTSAMYQDPRRIGWGQLLASGTYSRIIEKTIKEGCTFVEPTGRMIVIGTLSNDTSETGTPSSIPVPTPPPPGPGVVFRGGSASPAPSGEALPAP